MSLGFKNRPDVQLGIFSEKVFAVLARYTSFPWPVMKAQCARVGVDPAELTPADLARVRPHFVEAVARFTSPQTGDAVDRALAELAGER